MTPTTSLTTTHCDCQLAAVIENVIADQSFGTATKYKEQLQNFSARLRDTGAPIIDKRTIAASPKHLVTHSKSAITVSGQLSGGPCSTA